jgi:hypothetical protein
MKKNERNTLTAINSYFFQDLRSQRNISLFNKKNDIGSKPLNNNLVQNSHRFESINAIENIKYNKNRDNYLNNINHDFYKKE